MPRIGIQLEDVSRAVEKLEGQGRVAGPTNVRLQLGETGSYSTIQRLLAQVKQSLEAQRAAPTMSDSLQRLAAECIAKLWAAAYSEAHRKLEALEREHRVKFDALKVQLDQAQTEAGRFEFEVSRLTTELGDGHARLASMSEAIDQAASRAHALEAVVDELRRERRALVRGLRGVAGAASHKQDAASACKPPATTEAMHQGALNKAHRRLANSR